MVIICSSYLNLFAFYFPHPSLPAPFTLETYLSLVVVLLSSFPPLFPTPVLSGTLYMYLLTLKTVVYWILLSIIYYVSYNYKLTDVFINYFSVVKSIPFISHQDVCGNSIICHYG